MASTIQRSFAGGEISPSLYARADQVKYATGLRTCRNFIVQRYGGVMNRAGTEFVAEVKDSAKRVRLIRFAFNAEQTYILEFGDQSMRVFRDGAQLESGGAPYEIATPYTEDQLQALQYVQSADVVTITHPAHWPHELKRTGHTDWTLEPIDFRDGPYLAPNTDQDHILTPSATQGQITVTASKATFAQADADSKRLIRLKIPNRLIRGMAPRVDGEQTVLNIGPHSFRVGDAIDVTGTKDYDGSREIQGVDRDNHLVRIDVPFTYDQAAARNERQEITVDATGGTYKLTFDGAATGNIDFDASAATLQGELEGLSTIGAGNVGVSGGPGDSGGNNPYTVEFQGDLAEQNVSLLGTQDVSLSGGASTVTLEETFRGNDGRTARVSGIGIGDAELWGWGRITGYASATEVTVDLDRELNGAAPTREWRLGAWSDDLGYPATVSYAQQRLVFAHSAREPEKVWMSVTGDFHNFSVQEPLQDDDAVSFNLAGRQVNAVQHLLDLNRPVMLTTGGEWVVEGGQQGAITPTRINARQHGYNGSSALPPLGIGSGALFVQARRSIVRDLHYQFELDGYAGSDLTIFAAHLFDGHQVRDWDYQHIPHSVVWAAREDGALLGLTYVRDHEIFGWHRHDTAGGAFEQVAVVPEDDEDVLYVVVRRTIGGQTRRYIERMASRRIEDLAADAKFVDSGLTYDGRNTDDGHTMTLSGGSAWTHEETLTLTSSQSDFSASDVGSEIWLTAAGRTLRCEIVGHDSDTEVDVRPHQDVAEAFRDTPLSDWAKAVTDFSGLDHLEGETLALLGDGHVLARRTVESGAISIERPHALVHAGLPIEADLETLNLANPDGQTLIGRKKLVSRVMLQVESSRGIFAGPDPEHLTEYKQRATEHYDEPIAPRTGEVEIRVNSTWNDNGRVFVRQSDPLPLSVLAVVAYGEVSHG